MLLTTRCKQNISGPGPGLPGVNHSGRNTLPPASIRGPQRTVTSPPCHKFILSGPGPSWHVNAAGPGGAGP